MKNYITLYISIITFGSFAQTNIVVGTTTLQVDTLITGLDIPWEIIYGPDNHIWVTERRGIVSRINPSTGIKTVILDHVSNVYQNAESGMLGMVLHPNFSTTPEVFIAYTYFDLGEVIERIVKFTYNGTTLDNEQILLDGIPGNSTHNGCRLFILPDNTLLASTGDAQNPLLSQSMSSLAGKILRMNLDGSIPLDNPIPGNYLYSWGHRNVQGIAVGPNNNIFLSEHGAGTDDEFQVLETNRNYGWPNVEGFCNNSGEISFCNANNVKEPIYSWTPTIAPSDMLYYENVLFPEFHQKMLMTVLKDRKLIALELDASGDTLVGQEHYLTNLFGRLRDICVGPNKEIYLAANGATWFNSDPNTHNIIVLHPPNNLGINGLNMKNEIVAYPNPCSSVLNINTDNIESILIYSLHGVLMTELNNDDTVKISSTIDVSKLPNGIYFLRARAIDNHMRILKFQVSH